jgi:hypothetical protein
MKDLIDEFCGKIYGFLTADYHAGYRLVNGKRHDKIYSCTCVCGNIVVKSKGNIKKGYHVSCGCKRELFQNKEGLNKRLKHGHCIPNNHSKTHNSWFGMKQRCYNPKTNKYYLYGGRGITVCDQWKDSETGFQQFLNDMGERPEGTSIDRIDSDKNYEPSNCRWATIKEQNSHLIRRKKC